MFGPKAKAKDIKGTGKRLWGYLHHQRKPLIVVLLLVIAASALNLISPFLIGRAIDNYIVPRDFKGLGPNLGYYAGSVLIGSYDYLGSTIHYSRYSSRHCA